MTLGQITKRALSAVGIKAYSWKNLPWGISLERDLQRIFRDSASPTLFDVGANVGQTAIRFRTALPHAEIHCFEPIRSTFDSLMKNTKGLGNVHVHRMAIGSSCGYARMVVFENSEENKLLVGDSSENQQTEDVEMQTIDTFMEKTGISRIGLLKTDCEGFDLEVMLGAQQAIAGKCIDAILSEVSLKQGAMHTDFLTIHEHLLERGFYFFAFYDYGGWGEFHSLGQFHNALWLRDRDRGTAPRPS